MPTNVPTLSPRITFTEKDGTLTSEGFRFLWLVTKRLLETSVSPNADLDLLVQLFPGPTPEYGKQIEELKANIEPSPFAQIAELSKQIEELRTTLAMAADPSALVAETRKTSTSGTYTPTLTNVANLAASTAYVCQWSRTGNTVTVSGRVDIDPTAATTLTQLGISLPVASNLVNAQECAGVAACPAVAGQSAAILGDTTNDRAQLEYISGDIANRAMYFIFHYQVLP